MFPARHDRFETLNTLSEVYVFAISGELLTKHRA